MAQNSKGKAGFGIIEDHRLGGEKEIQISLTPKKIKPKHMQPLEVEGIHMIVELDEDEEKSFLRRNPTLIPLFKVDVVGIVNIYVKEGKARTNEEQFT